MTLCPSIIQRTRRGALPFVPDNALRHAEWALKFRRLPRDMQYGASAAGTALDSLPRSQQTDPAALIRGHS